MKVELGGIPLNAHRDISWGRSGGVRPFIVTLELLEARAEAIYAKREYQELKVDGVRSMWLWPLQKKAGSLPGLLTLVLADRRWELSYRLVVGDYNLRRRTGDQRLKGPRVEVSTQLPDIDYAPHSLTGNNTTTPEQMLQDVLKQCVGESFVIDAALPKVDLEDIVISHPGDTALAIALDKLPGLQVEVDLENRLRVYNDVYGATIPQKLYALGTYPAAGNRSNERPFRINVHYVQEAELRVNGYDGTQSTIVRSDADYPLPTTDLINVMKVPDPSADLPAGYWGSARIVGHGTWVPIDAYLAFCATQDRPASANQSFSFPLTQEVIRQHWLTGFNRLRLFYHYGPNPDPVWDARFDAIFSHWRQTWQLSRQWQGRLLGISHKRVAVYDSTTGIRAPSMVWCDHMKKPTWKGLSLHRTQRADQGWINRSFSRSGFKITPVGPSATSTVPGSPFELTLEDEEAFIVRLQPRQDPFGEVERVAPGTMDESLYMPRVLGGGFNRSGNPTQLFWEYAKLEASWQFGAILTALRGAPNGLGRYHQVAVYREQAEKVLSTGIGDCHGPDMDVFVPHQLVTARYGWTDEFGSLITNALAGSGTLPEVNLINRQHLVHVADAIAARLYESMMDRPDGQGIGTPYDPTHQPIGALKEVRHHLPRKGGLRTELTFQGPSGPLDIWPLLPESTRKFLQKTVTRD